MSLAVANMLILGGVFRFLPQDGMSSMDSFRHKFVLQVFITVCLQRAGEILPDKAIEEVNDDKFGQLMRNKTVHLLALFLMIYIGVEVTIGGIIFVNYVIV